jgi:KipI family sensor histidine kinase inhibitor
VRVLDYGRRALLVELDDPATVLGMATAAGRLPGVVEVVPAACTVLLRIEPGRAGDVRAALDSLEPDEEAGGQAPAEAITLDVRYDGPDLSAVATELGRAPAEVVRLHSAPEYVVAFCGFAPGFAYLTGLDPALEVPRLAQPRTRVPAGSVAIAAQYSAVYPRATPGGWRLLGTTDAGVWDAERRPPALLAPGTRVRFRPA